MEGVGLFYAFHSAVLLVESIVSRITVPWGKRAEEWQVLVLDTKSFDKKPVCHGHAIFLYVIHGNQSIGA
jgi:hypothetical protein